ncbi:Transcription initiation factor TFIID subunit 6 [Rhizophlyctis rosea]|nr:Transcription initiation factor TFIID subunit 6 [Rhizophlyctis rosea]
MSVFPKETVQSIADTVGVQLKEEVANALVQDVEYRLREIINESKKFMHHSKRSKLLSEDINCALRVRNVEPLYGYTTGSPSTFRIIPQVSQRLYYVDDQEIDLDEVIYGPLPSVPLDITYTGHWLAIEGVQPSIIQNPTPADLKETNTLVPRPSGVPASQYSDPTSGSEPLVKQVLTKELQLYYEKITASLLSASEDVRNVAVESVRKDPGIQPLVAYFVQFVAEKVSRNVKDLPNNWSMMRLTRAILDNMNLNVEPYLHQLIPTIITCTISRRLSLHPTEDHHALRRYASALISHICHKYAVAYPSLQPRITKTLLRAFLDPTKGLATRVGALVGLGGLGEQVVEALVRPNLRAFGDGLSGGGGEGEEAEGRRGDVEAGREAVLMIFKDRFRKEFTEAVAERQRGRGGGDGGLKGGDEMDIDGGGEEMEIKRALAETYGAFTNELIGSL